MKCDKCGEDYCLWNELFSNGKYTRNKITDDKIKMMVCKNCLEKEELNSLNKGE
jgi:hypothetical protein